jgi:transcriptional regulator with XRE-family HTH domain
MKIGERIKKCRGQTSIEKLAEKIGKSTGTVKNYESGKTEPTISDIKAIATALGADAIYLAFGNVEDLENVEQIEIINEIINLEESEKKTAREVVKALSLKSHAKRLS